MNYKKRLSDILGYDCLFSIKVIHIKLCIIIMKGKSVLNKRLTNTAWERRIWEHYNFIKEIECKWRGRVSELAKLAEGSRGLGKSNVQFWRGRGLLAIFSARMSVVRPAFCLLKVFFWMLVVWPHFISSCLYWWQFFPSWLRRLIPC